MRPGRQGAKERERERLDSLHLTRIIIFGLSLPSFLSRKSGGACLMTHEDFE